MKSPWSNLSLPLFRQLPLRWVLIIPFVLQTVGLATLVGYLSYQNGQRSVNDLVKNLQQEVESRICDRLDGYLTIPPQLNQINVDAYDLGRLDVSDFKTTGQYFWRQLQVFNVSFINFANAKGEYVGVGDFGDGKIRIEDVPINTKGKSYQYSTDGKGNRVQLFSVQDYNPFEEAWFTNALQSKKQIWSAIYNWDGFPQIMSISASYPVYGKDGRLVGVFGVDLKLSNISDFLSQLKIGKSGKAFVLERTGLLVASSVQEAPYIMVKGGAQRLPARQSKDVDIRLATKALQTELGSFQTLEGNHQLTSEFEGQKKYIQVSPWTDKLGLNWLVVMVVPESDFMAQIHANNLKTALLSLAALLVSVGLGIFTARWIAHPVLQLSQASQVFAQGAQRRLMGKFLEDESTITSSIHELETLSQSFYQMGAQFQTAFSELESANRDLENRVAQSTEDLAQANTKISQLTAHLQTDPLQVGADLQVVFLQYQDQQLQISGQPKEIWVCRANGMVEQIDTLKLGMPLGMMLDMQDFLRSTQIQLNSGDGVVLYTDGVVEAEGQDRALYGLERVITVVQESWRQSAQEIQQRVIEEMRSHLETCPTYEDITLIVFKQI